MTPFSALGSAASVAVAGGLDPVALKPEIGVPRPRAAAALVPVVVKVVRDLAATRATGQRQRGARGCGHEQTSVHDLRAMCPNTRRAKPREPHL